jgi:hypothetical protein
MLVLTQTQNVEKKKAEPKTPHFFSFNQDIVTWSQEEKWGLKYAARPTISTLSFSASPRRRFLSPS